MSFFAFRKRVRSPEAVFVAGVGMGVAAVVAFFLVVGQGASSLPVRFSPHPVLAQGITPAPGGIPSVATVAEQALPSVVNIASKIKVDAPRNPLMSDPFFRDFFGRRGAPAPRYRKGLGSGVIISSDGVVITNNHVVARAQKIEVVLADKRRFSARVVGRDEKSDLAVLKLKGAKGLKPITLGNSDKLRLGDVVLAIGNPFGVGQTVTMGIVSAKGRGNMGIVDYEDFIQTDAAINPGNSGGALVNMRGELVGINTAILSRTGGYQGIGFAIPTNMANPITRSLLKHGTVRRGWLGVVIQEPNREMAKTLGLPTHKGVLITDVDPRGPAGKAGLRRDDLVVKVDGHRVDTVHRLRNTVAAAGVGKRVALELYRKQKRMQLWVKLGALSSGAARFAGRSPRGGGFSVAPLTRQARQRYSVSPRVRAGVVVNRINPKGLAAGAGLREGDVLSEVNRVTITSVAQFRKVYTAARGRVLLRIHRQGHTIYMILPKPGK